MFHLEVLVLSALLASCCSAGQESINADLIVNKVQTTIDLTTHIPKINNNIVLENGGKAAVRSFLFSIDPVLGDKLSFIGAMVRLL